MSNPEAGFSITWRAIDSDGYDCLITMRADTPEGWEDTLKARRAMIKKSMEDAHWTVPGQYRQNTPQAAQQANQAPSTPTNGNGEVEEFEAETMALEFKPNGDKVVKVKGGKYAKFGVTLYPEAASEMGIDLGDLKPGNVHPFKRRVRVLLKENKPMKVIGYAA